MASEGQSTEQNSNRSLQSCVLKLMEERKKRKLLGGADVLADLDEGLPMRR